MVKCSNDSSSVKTNKQQEMDVLIEKKSYNLVC